MRSATEAIRLRPLGGLSPAEAALFAPPGKDLFASLPWFETIAADAAPPGHEACCAVLGPEAAPAMLLPVWCREGRIAGSLASPYTLEYRPLLAPDADAGAIGRSFGRSRRGKRPLRLDALDLEAPGLARWLAGCGAAGLRAETFDHFGNWHEPVRGLSFEQYLANRPGALRSTIRRKLKAAEAAARFEAIRSGVALEAGIAAFEVVYARSWKQPEPFPRFNAGFMRMLARSGLLRLGVLHAESGPIAAQYWTVSGGRAMLHKLAHDESALALSPGTVLTALMIRHLLNEDDVLELDFGRGDDPYKRNWAGLRRQRRGIVLFDMRHPAGLAHAGMMALGAGRRHLRAFAGGAARNYGQAG